MEPQVWFERWCRTERDAATAILARMEKGEMRTYATDPRGELLDVSMEMMARHRSSIEQLDGIIAKIEAGSR
ncbi:hypothetical protein MKK70_00600 [Methylobacterium sp. E-041]|uniref:hypothetical protein n=1 Tax=Methylobacterium sp. E-041 TaxID=2836573 RepID=UPI001FB98795|nr:hypothetical protein [Methylobacterium sp. E-041]MCJ2103904.1 hypothetical protein [Methylobacterium sp. E-041]